MFRKSLLYIRKNYNDTAGRTRFLVLWGIVFLLSVAAGVTVDLLLPFDQWWNLLRIAILVPSSAAGFILVYAFSLFLHYRKVSTDYDWVPYRARTSTTWRRRIAAIVAAVGFIVLYAHGMQPGYTFVTTGFVVLVAALFAYMRPSKAEARREILDIPDARDTRYEQIKERIEGEQVREERMKAKRKEYAKQERKKTRKQRREEAEQFEEEHM